MGERSTERPVSLARKLLVGNFVDLTRSQQLLSNPALQQVLPDDVDEFLASMRFAADPDQALWMITRLAEATSGELRKYLITMLHDGAAPEKAPRSTSRNENENQSKAVSRRQRLLAVIGASSALGDLLVRRPELLKLLDQAKLEWPREELLQTLSQAVSGQADPTSELRRKYREILLQIAAADLTADPIEALPQASLALADLAAATIEVALQIAQTQVPESDQIKFAVIGMGKTGGRELNYISDVDVMYVVEPKDPEVTDETTAVAIGTKLASALQKVISGTSPEPPLWEIDAGLRPEGKQGPLVRTIQSYLSYYQRWALNWEFQALLKSRAIAGDPELGAAFRDAIRPLVWRAVERESFVADVQAMRRRVENNIPKSEQERQIKLGTGGLRDVEFTIQLLQLVHGRTDESLRSRNTLRALNALADGGYLAREDAAELEASYRFLRALEHRVQLGRLKRTHLLPTAEPDLRRLGRALGSAATGRTKGQRSADALTAKFKATRRTVRNLHETLYYRPLLPAYAKLSADDVKLSPDAAKARLAAIGYRDPEGALRHISALTQGSSRRAALQRQLLPVLLGWFGDDYDPDRGLLAFRRLSDELGGAQWFLKLLRDSGAAAHSLVHLLGNSRYLDDAVARSPETVQWLDAPETLGPDLAEGWLDRISKEAEALVSRAETPAAAVTALRGLRRREMTRIAGGEVLGAIDRTAAAMAVSKLVDLVLRLGLKITTAQVCEQMGLTEPPTEVMIVAMGRLGGHELGYGSDADVMFVHQPVAGADEKQANDFATAVASQLRESLRSLGEEPPVLLDTDLRPEGKNGPLVRSLEAYREYYTKWSSPWEAQALLRARPLGEGPLADAFVALVNPIRYPVGGLSDAALKEIRRLKARMEAERLPRGVLPSRHLKLGPGGLSDVEWTVQLMQLRHGAEIPELQTHSTLGALHAAQQAGLIADADAAILEEAWTIASRLRSAIVLATGKTTPGSCDVLPNSTRELAGIAAVLTGYHGDTPNAEPGSHGGQQIADEYLRAARRARKVVDRLFFDTPEAA